jgi:penicillin-binding protein 1A
MTDRPLPHDDDHTLLAPEPEGKGSGWRGRAKKIGLVLGGLLLALFAWLWFAPCGLGGCAPVSELERFEAEGSQLLDVHDRPFGTLATVDRRVLALDSFPKYLPQAFVAVEDRRFYEHSGVDWKRMGGALKSLFGPGRAEGGSTITMQLARNLFPDKLNYRERSPRRKLMEIRVARQIERAFEKNKILELYLNHIYLGEGAYGVDAAAREYFGKRASQLTLSESALLGGLPKAPSQINPREDRDAARKRRNLVLGEMVKAGFIDEQTAEAARREPVRLARGSKRGTRERAAYFRSAVRRELEEQVGDLFYTAGLKVYTTYDPTAQAAAEEELFRQMDAVEAGTFGRYRHPTYPEAKGETDDGRTPYLQGVVILLDARTGGVRALVGGRDYEDSKFNRATQAVRQPGSAFKPFVYLTALEQGRDPTYRVEDAPLRLTLGGRAWEPRNYTGEFDGPITLRDALTRSKNVVTVRLAQEVGMDEVVERAREMGISTEISPLPSTALGASEVRPIELAQAYTPFANLGERVRPHYIRRIEGRDGRVLWEAPEERERVVDPAAAFVLTSMLRDVVDRGTGTPARAGGYRGPAAGKTGTTNAATDVWFVGYTPEMVGVVWMGLDRPQTIVRGASGGTIAAPVWGRVMRRVYAGRPAPRPWSPPGGVVSAQVDRLTGLAVDAECPARGPVYTEYFVNGVPPREACYPDTLLPRMAGGDTLWRDEEWAMNGDTLAGAEVAPGVYWPELAERRERGDTARQEPLPPPAADTASRPAVTPPARRPPREARRDTARAPEPPRPAPQEERREPPKVLGQPAAPPPPDSSATR